MPEYPIKEYFKAFRDKLKFSIVSYSRQCWRWLAKQPRWKLILACVGLPVLAISLLLLTLYFGVRQEWYGPLPDQETLMGIENDQASAVYGADGVQLGKYYIQNRVDASAEEVNPFVINGLVATEDARFFEHGGVDIRALFRVAIKTILLQNQASGGGSTISQQLAKNLYPRQRYRWLAMLKNKLREMIIASRLEKVYSKQELLLLYLNTVPFGDNAFGIKIAAQRFFNKSPNELTAEEAAVLIGLLKGNTSYNPRLHPEAALKRRNLVLYRMSTANYLPEGTLDSLQKTPLELDYRPEAHNRGLATYFREHLRRELKEILANHPKPNGQPYDLYRDGLKIYTTIDSRIQAHAEAAVLEVLPQLQENLATDWKKYKSSPWESAFQSHLKKSQRYRHLLKKGLSHETILEELRKPREMAVLDWQKGGVLDTLISPLDSLRHYFIQLNAGLLAAEPKTGLVRAWVGGGDHRFVQYDHVKSRRQVGSTIKPIVYAAALQKGMRPCEYTPAQRFTYEDYNNYNPGNPNGEYEGVYSMKGGLAKSVNTVAVNIAVRTGLDEVANFSKQMGLKHEVKPIPSLALGTAEASLWEMVPAYATFANGGRRPERLHYLDRIETAEGEVIVEFEAPNSNEFETIMSDSVAHLTTFLLSGVVNNGTAARLRSRHGLRGAIAAKTGTTQDQSDGWLLGFTPKLVVGSWVGAEYPAVHFRTLSRGSSTATALPLWGNFMRRVVRDKSLKAYQGGSFPALDELTMAYLQCPDYLEEMPIISDSLRQDVMAREIDPMDLEAMMQRKPRRRNESAADYLARMEQALEKEDRKDERRKKRKAFFRDLFFKKDEE